MLAGCIQFYGANPQGTPVMLTRVGAAMASLLTEIAIESGCAYEAADDSVRCWDSEAGTGEWCLKVDAERLIQVFKVDECRGIKVIEGRVQEPYHLSTDSWQSVPDGSSWK